jgi:hypothetical protein
MPPQHRRGTAGTSVKGKHACHGAIRAGLALPHEVANVTVCDEVRRERVGEMWIVLHGRQDPRLRFSHLHIGLRFSSADGSDPTSLLGFLFLAVNTAHISPLACSGHSRNTHNRKCALPHEQRIWWSVDMDAGSLYGPDASGCGIACSCYHVTCWSGLDYAILHRHCAQAPG